MRPLTVRTEEGSAPLLCRRLPVCGCCGGGESRLGLLQAELDGGLVGLLAESRQQVADFLLAVGDDAAGGGGVDGGGDVFAQLLELLAQARGQVVGGGLRLGVHRAPGVSRRDRRFLVGYDLPEDLSDPTTATPARSGPACFFRCRLTTRNLGRSATGFRNHVD